MVLSVWTLSPNVITLGSKKGGRGEERRIEREKEERGVNHIRISSIML